MTNRREFIVKSAALGAAYVTANQPRQALAAQPVLADSAVANPRIKGLVRRDETLLQLWGRAANGQLTWAADDRQFMAAIDGVGFSKTPNKGFHDCLFTVSGDPPSPTFEEVAGYPANLVNFNPQLEHSCYFGGGTLALDGSLYHFCASMNEPWAQLDGTFRVGPYCNASKLIYSPNNGLTWLNQDGTSPVIWEEWSAKSKKNMVFLDETPKGAFSNLTFLQMGKNYEFNQDGYLYVYSTNGVRGTELVMFRVPKNLILERDAYEFFSGLSAEGHATWTNDISSRAVAHTFPQGPLGDQKTEHLGWAASVVYNAPLARYMLVGSGAGASVAGGQSKEDSPSVLGVWIASAPWGPFTRIHLESAWLPGNDRAARASSPTIPAKWIADDGKSLWLVWTDGRVSSYDEYQSFFRKVTHITDQPEEARLFSEWARKGLPNFGFNMQRVDLLFS